MAALLPLIAALSADKENVAPARSAEAGFKAPFVSPTGHKIKSTGLTNRNRSPLDDITPQRLQSAEVPNNEHNNEQDEGKDTVVCCYSEAPVFDLQIFEDCLDEKKPDDTEPDVEISKFGGVLSYASRPLSTPEQLRRRRSGGAAKGSEVESEGGGGKEETVKKKEKKAPKEDKNVSMRSFR